jgi:hypothetical protein
MALTAPGDFLLRGCAGSVVSVDAPTDFPSGGGFALVPHGRTDARARVATTAGGPPVVVA